MGNIQNRSGFSARRGSSGIAGIFLKRFFRLRKLGTGFFFFFFLLVSRAGCGAVDFIGKRGEKEREGFEILRGAARILNFRCLVFEKI
jgi:hypothetical protein